MKLLRIDQSGNAHDVSFDAWNYLYAGYPATEKPTPGGAIAMEYEDLDASECADLIHTKDKKLPFSAANSMNFIASCIAQPDSWVARNYALYNILDSICTLGFDEECSLDLNVSNQPKCPNTLGLQAKLTSQPVYNIRYPSGEVVVAGTGEVVPPSVAPPTPLPIPGAVRGGLSTGAKAGIGVGVTLGVFLIAAAAVFWWMRRRRSQALRSNQDTMERRPTDESSISDGEEDVTEKGVNWRVISKWVETK